jgi:hypothetical protein
MASPALRYAKQAITPLRIETEEVVEEKVSMDQFLKAKPQRASVDGKIFTATPKRRISITNAEVFSSRH